MNNWPLDNPPVFLLGTHRSGTTWIGDLLGSHPDVAYWVEPRHVWTRGFARRPDDRLASSDATPKIASKIRNAFGEYTQSQAKSWFCEKTPSNCMRLPFMLEVFPDAKFIFVVRDGRSVLRSTGEIMDRGVPIRRIAQRALQTPPTEWPSYAGRAFKLIANRVTGRSIDWWGPQPAGWREHINDQRDEKLSWQWAASINTILDDVESLPEGRVMRFRYEDLATDPRATMTQIMAHIGIENPEPVIEQAATSAKPMTIDKWRAELDDETLSRVRPILEPTLDRLGYTW